MPDRPRVWLSSNLPPGAKITRPTRPWRRTFQSSGNGQQVLHAPVTYAGERHTIVALCRSGMLVLGDHVPDLPLCGSCVKVLDRHGLWPL